MSESKQDVKKKSDRTKYLLRSILGVDVDLIHSVHLAEKIAHYTKEWMKYMRKKGIVIVMPDIIIGVGKKKKENIKDSDS